MFFSLWMFFTLKERLTQNVRGFISFYFSRGFCIKMVMKQMHVNCSFSGAVSKKKNVLVKDWDCCWGFPLCVSRFFHNRRVAVLSTTLSCCHKKWRVTQTFVTAVVWTSFNHKFLFVSIHTPDIHDGIFKRSRGHKGKVMVYFAKSFFCGIII